MAAWWMSPTGYRTVLSDQREIALSQSVFNCGVLMPFYWVRQFRMRMIDPTDLLRCKCCGERHEHNRVLTLGMN